MNHDHGHKSTFLGRPIILKCWINWKERECSPIILLKKYIILLLKYYMIINGVKMKYRYMSINGT